MGIIVTVIVPVYNVKKYLDRCVQSLLNQTSDKYQIVLVDDGSTDGSGEKCDQLAENSNIITVLHKANGGLSDARNYALDYVNTEYVTFVDSDDYVEPQYIELLLKGLKLGVDLVITHHVQEYEGNPKRANISYEYRSLNAEEALKLMCYEELSTSAWGKLIPTQFCRDNPFPKGKIYEDLLTIYKHIGRSKGVAFNESQTYHYLQRKGSIRQSKWNERCFDVMEGAENLLNYISTYYPNIYKAGVFRYFYSSNELIVRAFASEKYLDIIKPIRKKLSHFKRDLISDSDASKKHKIQFLLMLYMPSAYRYIWLKKKRSF